MSLVLFGEDRAQIEEKPAPVDTAEDPGVSEAESTGERVDTLAVDRAQHHGPARQRFARK